MPHEAVEFAKFKKIEPANDEKVSLAEDEDANAWRDWDTLRRLSLRPGGFGTGRRRAWKFLLNVDGSSSTCTETPLRDTGLRRRKPPPEDSTMNGSADATLRDSEMDTSPDTTRKDTSHPDEHQIKLDTDRSFVLYSVDDGSANREEMQTMLNVLLAQIFRQRPALRYFQGYHDIITVILLTMPPEERLLCAEQLSLHRLRDSMGKGMEPMLGLLHIMKYLMRLVDSEYAALLERSAPLPYFALSNLLTLFSHDVPTLPLIQHLFDFLLCREPIAVVYLATALTLARRAESFEMEAEGEEGMLHSLLTQLPNLSGGDEQLGEDCKNQPVTQNCPKMISSSELESEHSTIDASYSEKEIAELPDEGSLKEGNTENESTEPASLEHNGMEEESKSVQDTENNTSETFLLQSKPSAFGTPSLPNPLHEIQEVRTRSASPTPSHASSTHSVRRHRPTVSLPALLSRADALYTEFPPTLPALHVYDILGPNSVVHTWNEDPTRLPSNDEAESMATNTSLIVLPFVDPDEAAASAARQTALEKKRAEAERKKILALSTRYGMLNGVSRLCTRTNVFGGAIVTIAFICMFFPRAHSIVYSILSEWYAVDVAETRMLKLRDLLALTHPLNSIFTYLQRLR